MKRKLLRRAAAILALPALLLMLTACGRVFGAQRITGASTRFSPAELDAAMDTVVRHFLLHFEGCTLTELCYDEELSDRAAAEWAEQYGARDAIVLTSSFRVGAHSDGSLSPNTTYTRWQWILTCDIPGVWTLRTWGYG